MMLALGGFNIIRLDDQAASESPLSNHLIASAIVRIQVGKQQILAPSTRIYPSHSLYVIEQQEQPEPRPLSRKTRNTQMRIEQNCFRAC